VSFFLLIGSPEERRHAVIRLHAQGWSISTIARYLEVSRWVKEGVLGLADKSHANTSKPAPQGRLWELDETMWKLAKRLPDYAPGKRQRRKDMPLQLPLLEDP